MGRREDYRLRLLEAADPESLLRSESGLPGPRANLELAQAAADIFDRTRHLHWTTDEHEYLALCGAVGLGRLAAEGDGSVLPRLKELASDPRWRVREGVAMGLQRLGAADMDGLLEEMESWAASASPLEQRAVVAAVCEPALLKEPAQAREVLAVLDMIMSSMASTSDRDSEPFRVLRLALAYGWSVAAAA